MARHHAISPNLVGFLKRKALNSSCNYRVSAIAFDKKGNIIGHVTNKHSSWDVVEDTGTGRPGTAKHAERLLMMRYKGVVRTIVICRIGHGGALRPIVPCKACQKVADKLGVKIISVGCEHNE